MDKLEYLFSELEKELKKEYIELDSLEFDFDYYKNKCMDTQGILSSSLYFVKTAREKIDFEELRDLRKS